MKYSRKKQQLSIDFIIDFRLSAEYVQAIKMGALYGLVAFGSVMAIFITLLKI